MSAYLLAPDLALVAHHRGHGQQAAFYPFGFFSAKLPLNAMVKFRHGKTGGSSLSRFFGPFAHALKPRVQFTENDTVILMRAALRPSL